MKTMLKIEFKRIKKSRSFWISLLTGTLLLMIQIFMDVLPKALNPLELYRGTYNYPYTLYTSWAGGDSNVYMATYLYIFPILAASAYAITYYTDCKDGYIKNIVTKTSRKYYLLGKYVASFISGGIVVTIPMIINFMVTASMLPAINIFLGEVYVNPNMLMAQMLYYHPILYFLIFMVIYFIYGGAFACIALAGSYFIKNVFLLSLFPFVVWYILQVVSKYINIEALKSIYPSRMLKISGSYTTWLSVIGEAVILIVTGFIIYYWKGRKADVI